MEVILREDVDKLGSRGEVVKVKNGFARNFLLPRRIAIAANDDTRSPNDKTTLKETFAKANLAAEIEVYTGAAHGWCPPDSQVYNEALAEKAWGRLLALYGKALA